MLVDTNSLYSWIANFWNKVPKLGTSTENTSSQSEPDPEEQLTLFQHTSSRVILHERCGGGRLTLHLAFENDSSNISYRLLCTTLILRVGKQEMGPFTRVKRVEVPPNTKREKNPLKTSFPITEKQAQVFRDGDNRHTSVETAECLFSVDGEVVHTYMNTAGEEPDIVER